MSRNRNRPRPATPRVEPTLIDLDGPAEEPKEREPLFKLGGKVYTIPVAVPAGWLVMASMIAVESGETQALAWATRRMLGDEGWNALQEAKLHDEQFAQILKVITTKVFPVTEAGAPKAS